MRHIMSSNLYVICKICNIRDPRMLTCLHSFCLKCLESSSVAKESSKCQIWNSTRWFEIFEEIIELLSKPKLNTAKCDSCKENQATNFCVDCSFNCSSCLKYQGKIPTSRKHRLQSTTSSEGNKNNYNIVLWRLQSCFMWSLFDFET